jgi:hypothetical protein
MTTEKYKNRYRIASARAAWWSYDWAGAYFITICTKNREHFFGHVKKGEMYLSPIGELAHKFWYEIPNHAHNVELGAFQVTPNHLHGILILNGWTDDRGVGNGSVANLDSRSISDGDCVETLIVISPIPPIPPVETRHALSLPVTGIPRTIVMATTLT